MVSCPFAIAFMVALSSHARRSRCARSEATDATSVADPVQLAQRAERGPELFREELRLLPGREVAALVGLVEIVEGGVRQFDPAARSLEDLARKRGEADRHRDRR